MNCTKGQTVTFQAEKQLVLRFYQELQDTPVEELQRVFDAYYSPEIRWRGFHPFNEIGTSSDVVDRFWQPLKKSLKHMQRRQDIFFAGQNVIDGVGGRWVSSSGHLMGLFDESWLGIPPSRKLTMLRYSEFSRVENGKITEVAMFFDIPHLMHQAGLRPFPPQTGAELVQPGPLKHDGLLFDPQPPEDGEKTLGAIQFMIDDIKHWTGGKVEPLEDELRRSWDENMLWWGPSGIGATYTIDRYAKQHSGPFRAGFANRCFNGHVCRMAEGHFGGFFGWPNLTLTPTGGFMGMPGTGKPGDMRVIDIYRRDKDKLTENWIYIDLLHFWKMQGVDVLERTTGLEPSKASGW